MKKTSKLLIVFLCIFLTGCTDNEENNRTMYSTEGLNHTECTRAAYIDDDSTDVNINIDLYYDDNGYLKVFSSQEKITSKNTDTLDQYETAYKNIYKQYKNVKYYDNVVVRNSDSVVSTTKINYGRVDMDKIYEIEGKEDNVKAVNGKIKVDDWKSFAEKYGTICK